MAIKTGRGRPSTTTTDRQNDIRKAARSAFDELGYDRASIREIASRAKVDPKLVVHYFGSKPELFAAVLEVPAESARAIAAFGTTPKAEWGRAFADIFMQPDGKVSLPPMLGILRSATIDPQVAQTIREFYVRSSMGGVLASAGIDNAEVRASCMSPVLAGFVFADQVLGIPVGGSNFATARRELFEQLIQTILTAPLD